MAQFSFKTRKGHDAVLTIAGATVSSNCQLASEPFVTEVKGDEDFFCPIRTQSGTIKIIGGMSDIDGIIGAKPQDRPVTLKIDDSVVWKGFLQSSSYSQSWTVGPNEIQIPVISPLALSEGINIRTDDRGWSSFSEFISEFNEALGNVYTQIHIPSRNSNYLNYKFNRLNYMSYEDDEKAYVGQSYYSIIEDICKFFGWQCQESGDHLYFLAIDQEYSSTVSLTLIKADHEVTYNKGKKSVEASANFDNEDTEIVKLGIDDMDLIGFEYFSRTIDSKKYYYAEKEYDGGTMILVSNKKNAKYLDFNHATTSNRGACICEERTQYIDGGYYGEKKGETSYNSRISWRLSADSKVCGIYPLKNIESYDSDEYLRISFTAKQAANPQDPFEICPDGLSPFKISLKVGSFYYNFQDRRWVSSEWLARVYLSNGQITPNAAEDIAFGGFVIPFRRGAMEIEIYSLNDDMYYSMDEFSVDRVLNWTVGDAVKDLPIRKKYEINKGFDEEYTIESTLACRERTHQISYAFIWDAIALDYPTSVCSNGKRPEVDLADRLRSHYSATKKIITATVESDGNSLNPNNKYSASSMVGYACLSQSVNWRDDIITGKFFEL